MAPPPTVRATWTVTGRYAVRCPYCKGRHTIEPRPGSHKLFCHVSQTPLPLVVLSPIAPRPEPQAPAGEERDG